MQQQLPKQESLSGKTDEFESNCEKRGDHAMRSSVRDSLGRGASSHGVANVGMQELLNLCYELMRAIISYYASTAASTDCFAIIFNNRYSCRFNDRGLVSLM